MTDVEDFAWACGLFEGEGCIRNHVDRNSRRNLRRLQLGIADLDVLERFQTIMGGTILAKPNRGTNRPVWRWQLTHWDDIEPLLRRMLPFLGIRRRAAAEALLANPPSRRSPGRLSGQWKPGESCERCGTTDRPHRSLGLCGRCYIAARRLGIV